MDRRARVTIILEFPIDPDDWGGEPGDTNPTLSGKVEAILADDPSQVVYLLTEHSHTTAVEVFGSRAAVSHDIKSSIAKAFAALARQVDGPKMEDILGCVAWPDQNAVRVEVCHLIGTGAIRLNDDRTLTWLEGSGS